MRRIHLGAVVGGTAAAVGALLIAAPSANAEKLSEHTIKAECKDAGGEYNSHVVDGHRYSGCSYADNSGERCDDSYIDGEYTHTICANDIDQGLGPASIPPNLPTLSVATPTSVPPTTTPPSR